MLLQTSFDYNASSIKVLIESTIYGFMDFQAFKTLKQPILELCKAEVKLDLS